MGIKISEGTQKITLEFTRKLFWRKKYKKGNYNGL